MRIGIIGTGYVGLVTGTCFAETGNDVVCIDIDERKIGELRAGRIPIYEPGLEELIRRNVQQERLRFSTDLPEAVGVADIVFIAVGTPPGEDGSSDLSHVLQAARAVAKALDGFTIIVNKSTVPVGTAERVRQEIERLTDHPFEVVSNPEFLKEGAAIDDFMRPDRVVVGVECERAASIMRELYAPFMRTGARILFMDTRSAEMTKYAANAMLASRISFMNEIANLCERVGADIDWIRQGIGTDARIGRSFLFSGVGYGGSCFPKDIKALVGMGREVGYPMRLVQAIEEVNEEQKRLLLYKVDAFFSSSLPQELERKAAGDGVSQVLSSRTPPMDGVRPADLRGRTCAVWGLSFKPRTDDMREAPSRVIIQGLLDRGAKVQVYDPEAMHEAAAIFGDVVSYAHSNYDALEGADALLLITEWNVFRNPDFPRMLKLMKLPVIFDGRNQYFPDEMRRHGFLYFSIGRPPALGQRTLEVVAEGSGSGTLDA